MMTEFNTEDQSKLLELFRALNEAKVQYVVPRGYRNLPACVPGNDVDIVVSDDDYERAKEVSRSIGFDDRSVVQGGVVGLSSQIVSNPVSAVRFAYRNPENVFSIFKQSITTTEQTSEPSMFSRVIRTARVARNNPRETIAFILTSPGASLRKLQNRLTGGGQEKTIAGGYSSIKLRSGDVTLHYVNHLVYESPMDGSMIRVDPRLENALYRERERTDEGFFIPSPPDELLHLVCRGLFDYKGEFPEYYVDRCDTLRKQIIGDDSLERSFRNRLELAFFSAAPVVYNHISNGSYDKLLRSLIQYDEY